MDKTISIILEKSNKEETSKEDRERMKRIIAEYIQNDSELKNLEKDLKSLQTKHSNEEEELKQRVRQRIIFLEQKNKDVVVASKISGMNADSLLRKNMYEIRCHEERLKNELFHSEVYYNLRIDECKNNITRVINKQHILIAEIISMGRQIGIEVGNTTEGMSIIQRLLLKIDSLKGKIKGFIKRNYQ